MDPVDMVARIIDWVQAQRTGQNEDIKAYLDTIGDLCRGLTEVTDPTGQEAVYIHEQIKQMYDCASSKLPPTFMDTHGGVLYRALSSARIYYWLQVVNSLEGEELQRLLDERSQRPSSLENMAIMLSESRREQEGGPVDILGVDLDRLRRQCLEDISALIQIRPV